MYYSFVHNKRMNEIAQVVRIYSFPALPREMLARISAGRTEASKVWMKCRDLHQAARIDGTKWPNRDSLQRATKGYALHSQSTQMVCHAFLANVQTTRELKRSGHHKARYPYKDKRYYPLLWPAQAVSVTKTTIVLPMGRGRASIVLPKPEGFVIGGCKLVWSGSANELHVTTEVTVSAPIESSVVATVDLGQIHQAAVTTNTGAGLIVSGRGQRSLKRRMNMMHGEIARLQSRCKKGSRRWKKLARARHAKAGRIERQVRDLAHKGTTAVIDFCRAHDVSRIFVGDPHGVRKNKNGRKHNQRMAQWEYGRDKRYLTEKSQRAGMTCFTGSERGTSSRCPSCGHKHKPRGRVWHCKACGFTGHRDLVGSVNMHEDNFEKLTAFPSLRDVTYLRPGNALLRLAVSRSNAEAAAPGVNNLAPGSSSRPDTGHGEALLPLVPALLSEPHPNTAVPDTCPSRAPQGAGHWVGSSTEAYPL